MRFTTILALAAALDPAGFSETFDRISTPRDAPRTTCARCGWRPRRDELDKCEPCLIEEQRIAAPRDAPRTTCARCGWRPRRDELDKCEPCLIEEQRIAALRARHGAKLARRAARHRGRHADPT